MRTKSRRILINFCYEKSKKPYAKEEKKKYLNFITTEDTASSSTFTSPSLYYFVFVSWNIHQPLIYIICHNFILLQTRIFPPDRYKKKKERKQKK